VARTAVSKRILVVDDDDSIRDMVEMGLSDEGYEVRTASDGATALSVTEKWQADVILLDMKMPIMDGWTFAAAYRHSPKPQARVIVLTAAQNAERWAEEIGADAVLAKPFDLEHLFAVVEQ
jgi:two-component system, chemotaxis family, chemotaxis protein CheY